MKFARCICIYLLTVVLQIAWSQQKAQPIYQNAKAPIPERVRDLIGRMTL